MHHSGEEEVNWPKARFVLESTSNVLSQADVSPPPDLRHWIQRSDITQRITQFTELHTTNNIHTAPAHGAGTLQDFLLFRHRMMCLSLNV